VRTPTLVRVFAAAMVAAFAVCGGEGITPPPPSSPSGSVSSPDLGSLEKGAPIAWSAQNATTCTASWKTGSVSCSGNEIYVSPNQGWVKFELSFCGPGGCGVAKDSTRFIHEPVAIIKAEVPHAELGTPVQFNWECRNSTPVSQSWPPASPPAATAGAFVAAPVTEGYHTQRLGCGNELGIVFAEDSVFVFAGLGERTRVDRPDEFPGEKVRFVYATCAGGPDRARDTGGWMDSLITAAQMHLAAETGTVFTLDTYQGRPDVLYLPSRYTCAELVGSPLGGLVGELVDAGLLPPSLLGSSDKYILVYEGASTYVCGGAGRNTPIGGIFLAGGASVPSPTGGCYGESWQTWSTIVLHELFHTLGAVCESAPDHDPVMPGHSMVPGDILNVRDPKGLGQTVDTTRRNYWGSASPDGCDISQRPWIRSAPPALVAAARSASALRAEPLVSLHGFREEIITLPLTLPRR
jgi:hypothetical protein